MSKYNYKEIYNEHWDAKMQEFEKDINAVGILRFDNDDNNIWGFTNVYSEDESPYDFCARIGMEVLRNLSLENVEYIKISTGHYGM